MKLLQMMIMTEGKWILLIDDNIFSECSSSSEIGSDPETILGKG